MKIILDNTYEIVDDGEGFRLQQQSKKTTKEGVEVDYMKIICYPSTLISALKKYANIINNDYVGDIAGYIERIENTLKPYNKYFQ